MKAPARLLAAPDLSLPPFSAALFGKGIDESLTAWQGWGTKTTFATGQAAEKGCISPKILNYVPRWLKPTLI